MKNRLATLAVALTALVGTGAAAAAGPAQATTPSHHLRTGPAHAVPDVTSERLFLNLNVLPPPPPQRCVVAQGTGNQVAIKDPAGNYCARFTTVNGNEFQDGNGHCLRANSASQVKIEDGSCNSSDSNEQWTTQGSCSSSCTIHNVGRQAYMKVNGWSSGDLVWVGFFPPGYGTWYFTP